ncbi:bifunctional 3-demethylubiquinone-9 3-methyltransferase/ 2-octaprenyl-6-hydroxy phenol methylase [Rubripirellula lacrimiformis]|uniref:Bifunctional 3-demethylubiquinone-9 3-methyltransferase/ 2-octaprenyl-6-hydroxy phenol methylase n=1 Tax=Rubripirellula lacrimiformis TaxID=1930273 RepID=A0A517NFH6_9BACT|nr:class I SAM-dependent methyltransferase [Rubripirellula lacrimiformis]QDT05886.1 bifunctional 3-demethylubiquinone-9 3-methyltransferase/ 2-octaprenyl-6-hydroxy phenol methylase [Rubripirellula lacrimiformis]
MTTNAEISQFYDQFNIRLLRDFIYGNLRLNMALQFVKSAVTSDVKNVLDVGCGIGTTSLALAKSFPELKVLGVDISAQNIQAASRLSANERIEFSVSDMTTPPRVNSFEVITMVDVYEHIPCEARSVFHATVGRSLAENGIVVLTTPSRKHQEWLAEFEPEGLQIVDEIVDRSHFEVFAKEIGASVVAHQSVNVWTPGQYCYTVLSRGQSVGVTIPSSEWSRRFPLGLQRRIESRLSRLKESADAKQRRAQVREVFGVDIDRKSHRWLTTRGNETAIAG